jgi:integrase
LEPKSLCNISGFYLILQSFVKKLVGRACPPPQVSASAYSPRLTSTAISSAPPQNRPAYNQSLFQQDAHRIIRRRAKAAGIETRIGNHTFRATCITAYLKNSGKLEVAQQIANHESPRTTKLYDRR